MTPAERDALVEAMSREERAALVAACEAANIRDAITEALRGAPTAQPTSRADSEPSSQLVVMGPEEAAAFCGIGVNAMRDLLRSGAVPHRRQGRNYLVRAEALTDWMQREEEAEHRRGLSLVRQTG